MVRYGSYFLLLLPHPMLVTDLLEAGFAHVHSGDRFLRHLPIPMGMERLLDRLHFCGRAKIGDDLSSAQAAGSIWRRLAGCSRWVLYLSDHSIDRVLQFAALYRTRVAGGLSQRITFQKGQVDWATSPLFI